MRRVIGQIFGTIRRNAGSFLLLSMLATVPIAVLKFITSDVAAALPGSYFVREVSHLALVAVTDLVAISTNFMLLAALVRGTIADLSGQSASADDCLQTVIKNCLAAVGLGIVTTIATVAGMVLLIVPGMVLAALSGAVAVWAGLSLLVVPGFILALAWSVAVPVRVVEQRSFFDCFRRSAELTRGHRWVLFRLVGLWWLGAKVLGLATVPFDNDDVFSTALTHPPSTSYILVSSFVAVITSMIAAAGIAFVYCELRLIKENAGPQQLAAVFD